MVIKKFICSSRACRIFSSFIMTALLALILSSCSGKTDGPPKQLPVPVDVADAIVKTVPVKIDVIGNVEAYAAVSIKAQVNGALAKVHFREGEEVKAGDLLFTIDPKTYESRLSQAEANLKKDSVRLENARVESVRYADLVKKGYVAQEQYDQVKTNENVLEATVAADKANVDNARLQLSYCFIRAPFSGRTGNLLLHEGDLIKANDTAAMVTLAQIEPIYVDFSVPQQYLMEIKALNAVKRLKVDAFSPEDEKHPEGGVLTFINNTVDVNTGTVLLKAEFPNRDRKLWPGLFVKAAILLKEAPDSVVVPAQAIQNGQQGQYVFVVKPDLTVDMRTITSRPLNSEAVIESGVKAGERVVTDGQLRLVPGSKVEIKNAQQVR